MRKGLLITVLLILIYAFLRKYERAYDVVEANAVSSQLDLTEIKTFTLEQVEEMYEVGEL